MGLSPHKHSKESHRKDLQSDGHYEPPVPNAGALFQDPLKWRENLEMGENLERSRINSEFGELFKQHWI